MLKRIDALRHEHEERLAEKDEEVDFVREQARKQISYVMTQQKEYERTFVERAKLQDLSLNWQVEQVEKSGKENKRSLSPTNLGKGKKPLKFCLVPPQETMTTPPIPSG